jgi:hypothetical protein
MTTANRTRRSRRWVLALAGGIATLLVVAVGLLVPRVGSTTPGDSERTWVSGAPMPVGDLAGWQQIFADDFNRDEPGENWGPYSGTPGGDPYSHWEPEHVEVGGSLLTLRGERVDGRWVTGGVSNYPVTQTYGKWEIRVRVDKGDEITYHFLLWPYSGQWPPEIDFLEDWGGDRSQASGFMHWVTPDGRDKTQRTLTADFSQWQTVGVEWLPGSVTFTLDGRPWGQITGPDVPSIPMWLGLQSQAGGCRKKIDAGVPGCPVVGQPDRADVQVDWVVVYAPAAG